MLSLVIAEAIPLLVETGAASYPTTIGADMTLLKPFSMATPITALLAASCAFLFVTSAQASGKAAIFQFELRHGDLVPGAPQKLAAEERRIRLVTDRLREHFVGSGIVVEDIKPVEAKAAAVNLDSCTACAADLARQVGADFAVIGTVYRVSELVLSMNVRVYDAATGRPLSSAVVDMRGNTDESWTRAVDYLYRRMLAPRLEKVAQ